MVGEVYTGIYRLRLPVPGALRNINSYLLKGQDGWAVIDAGPNLPGCREKWETAMDDLGIQFSDIKQILITHGHIDHVGLAGWLQEQTGATVFMSETEYRNAFYPEETEQAGSLFFREGMLSLGITAKEIEKLTAIVKFITEIAEPWPQVQFLQNNSLQMGDRTWEVVLTTGHTYAHVCLFNREEGLLLSGDQILPTISTVIRFPTTADDNPLGQYLESITRLAQLKPSRIMPAHGEPFNDMDARIEQLFHHHQERLQIIMDCLSGEPCSVRTVVNQLFGAELDEFNLFLATGEVTAHLLMLHSQGKAQVSQDPSTGLYMFSLA
jgi:glyoxylase-like metal-dependent hydrolase (beta-lactamase superfamily II)